MSKSNPVDRERLRESLLGTALLLLFGCSVLAFLVAIDHPNWFSIRPATGTSIAMAKSASAPDQSGANGTAGRSVGLITGATANK
ncbi:hypothetical protein WSK_1472 [Novosphingobium sp. Rr 2-17]|uniref:hypothetical protein n=1 Tax=Novosphingobium sp. Rr 2-17 TaxID=555793 RepID=UPI0002698EC0|nr:hypothetical protein [Novosphingobium sp. Rr 2-17]EIZ79934.1 hypothetical protein WSK_1472 [Novosphingobium sp. Rr 2-17]